MSLKKTLLHFAIFLSPIFSFAQTDQTLFKDLSKRSIGISQFFKLDDHTSIMQIDVGKNQFEIVAIDDKLQVRWRTTLAGYSLHATKFRNHILAISAGKESTPDEIKGPFNAFLINEQTGEVISQKLIFDSKSGDEVYEQSLNYDDQSNIKLVFRTVKTNKRPLILPDGIEETLGIKILHLNDQLDPIFNELKVPQGTFKRISCNNNGDIFILTGQENSAFKLWRYEEGKVEPSVSIEQDFNLRDKSNGSTDIALIAPSDISRNIAFVSLVHKNHDKKVELTVGKFDFETHKSQVVGEVFTAEHAKEIEKSYVPLNKDFDKPRVLNGGDNLLLDYIKVHNGSLILSLSEVHIREVQNMFYRETGAIVVNGYDQNLNRTFQQVAPVHYHWVSSFYNGYCIAGDSLYLFANTSEPRHETLYGELDLISGKWKKLERLAVDKKYFSQGKVVWSKDGLLVPLLVVRNSFLPPLKYSIDLKLVNQ